MSNFNGYLLKVGSSIVPNRFIAYETYESTPNQVTDLDSYTDATGLLHRNPLPHTSTKIEFEVPPMHLEDKIEFQGYFPNRSRVNLTYWNDEVNNYASGIFYVPSITFPIRAIVKSGRTSTISYMPVRVALIEY